MSLQKATQTSKPMESEGKRHEITDTSCIIHENFSLLLINYFWEITISRIFQLPSQFASKSEFL